MAQKKFESASVKLSKQVGDEVYSATTDGKTFTADDRLKAINRARGKVYTEMLHKLGMDALCGMFPEMTNVAIKTLQPVKDSDIRKSIKVFDESNSLQPIEEIPAEVYFNSQFDGYSKYKGIRFAEYGNKIEIINVNPV